MKERLPLTAHALQMLRERGIRGEWVTQVLESPAQIEKRSDGTVHYMGPVPEHGGRVLRVVVNAEGDPPRVITVFFDRRRGRKT